MKIGYARVSTREQNLEAQIDQLQVHVCEKIYQERNSEGDREQPVLNELLGYLRPGDTLAVVKLDRLSWSLKDLFDLTARIDALGRSFCHLMNRSTPARPMAS